MYDLHKLYTTATNTTSNVSIDTDLDYHSQDYYHRYRQIYYVYGYYLDFVLTYFSK